MPILKRNHLGALLVAIAPLSCVATLDDGPPVAAAEGADGTAAPLIGADGAGDFADRGCKIVLRDAGRVQAGGGFAVIEGTSRWLFDVRVDIDDDALAEGFIPRVLARAGSGGWRAYDLLGSTGIRDGVTRALFHIDGGDLPGPGISTTALGRARVEVIPFLEKHTPLGLARHFDHNRVVDATDAYVLNASNGFAVGDDDSVCAPPQGERLTFAADFTETQSASIVAGRSLVVDYDLRIGEIGPLLGPGPAERPTHPHGEVH